jgi:hypothetical protein
VLISAADNRALRSTVDRAYQTPPTFLPLTMGGGSSWWYFPCGTLIHVTFLSTRTPLTHYHLPPNPPSEKTTKPLIHTTSAPTSHSTTRYTSHSTTMLCLHTPLHCLHVSPTSADHLNKDMWQTTSARTCGRPHQQGHMAVICILRGKVKFET